MTNPYATAITIITIAVANTITTLQPTATPQNSPNHVATRARAEMHRLRVPKLLHIPPLRHIRRARVFPQVPFFGCTLPPKLNFIFGCLTLRPQGRSLKTEVD
jgi:hypothetical protein